MTSKTRSTFITSLVIMLVLLLAACQSREPNGTPDYPVTVIPPATTVPATQVPPPSWTPEVLESPTIAWDAVTLLPLRTPESEPETIESPVPEHRPIPDPMTEADLDLLAPGHYPFTLQDVEISLGRVVLPVDLLSLAEMGPFSVRSIPIEGYPNWRFIAFDLPLPAGSELGAVVRAPIDGVVMAGVMQTINSQMAKVINIDHPLEEGQLLRAAFMYTGTIEPLFVMGQQVEAGEVLFRLTRDTGRLETLSDTLILGGATMTLHASVDTVNQQPSGIEELVFLRGVSLTPAGFLKDEDGLIISPVN